MNFNFKRLLITGGAGFIGSTVIRNIINNTNYSIINIDKLTYAGNLESLFSIANNPRYNFEQVDICNENEIKRVFVKYKPDIIMHLAAESHVDRSIDDPSQFIQTNIIGTYVMLEVAREYWNNLKGEKKKNFRFHHISTDEVYGDLEDNDSLFNENTPYSPSSPYSASKASSDHLVRSWSRTYNFPTVITNCSNNYGPYQFPEKLIPLMIINAISGKPRPIYGNGRQKRDWLYVEDHSTALLKVLLEGEDGETYNIGGYNEKTNLEIVQTVCKILDKLVPNDFQSITKYEQLITYVPDRPGHDMRYAIDASKIEKKLNWQPLETFDSGIFKTVRWYLNNKKWWKRVLDSSYKNERERTKD